MRSNITRTAAAIFAMMTIMFAFPHGAQASSGPTLSTPSCPSGYLCAWKDDHYSGSHFKDADKAYRYDTITFDGTSMNANDKVSSISVHFTRCYARFYKDYSMDGDFLTFSYATHGGYYQDPYLTNGGPGSTENFDNEISSHLNISCTK